MAGQAGFGSSNHKRKAYFLLLHGASMSNVPLCSLPANYLSNTIVWIAAPLSFVTGVETGFYHETFSNRYETGPNLGYLASPPLVAGRVGNQPALAAQRVRGIITLEPEHPHTTTNKSGATEQPDGGGQNQRADVDTELPTGN